MSEASKEKSNKKEVNKKGIEVLPVVALVLTGVLPLLFSFVYQKGVEDVIRNTISAIVCGGVLLFLVRNFLLTGDLQYNNAQHEKRFWLLYIICLFASVLLPFVRFEIWPYTVIFVILGLYSNFQIGIYTGTFLLSLSVLLQQDGDVFEVLLYVICGMVALALLQNLDESMNIGAPIFIIELLLFLLLCAFCVLYLNVSLSVSMFVLPIVNVVLTGILLVLFLQMFSTFVVRGTSDRYMEINDTEFPLMVMLKDKNKSEFYRAVHTAFFAERAATELGLDARPVKTCAYYSRIGVLEGDLSYAPVKRYSEEFDFPEEARLLLQEYYQHAPGAASKELSIIMICETVVASALYLFQKDAKAGLDIDVLVDKVADKKLASGQLTRSALTLQELDQIKKLLKKEKLYYDFLR